jgi:hypothetical protein
MTKLEPKGMAYFLEKEEDLFEKYYCFIRLGLNPNFFENALENELRLS